MRKAILLATAMLFAFAGTASAAPGRPAMVAGHYTYYFSPAGNTRTVTVIAADAAAPKGVFLWQLDGTSTFNFGKVECLAVSGPDAWISGPVTRTQAGPQNGSLWLLLRLHDGKLSGKDEATTFGETPADGLSLCQAMAHGDIDAALTPIVSGGITVAAGH